ncbi:hypothetical protein EGW08_009689 [Elysia chlorotica]|uniref:Uncharacterized protein n=1 Tax=Elysia chlorotica TaxID=188477 RepID=A0A3S0ZTQ3_ELYCH|nr:hypothetical protein EGW08_009689 [Elysia chlorotica]
MKKSPGKSDNVSGLYHVSQPNEQLVPRLVDNNADGHSHFCGERKKKLAQVTTTRHAAGQVLHTVWPECEGRAVVVLRIVGDLIRQHVHRPPGLRLQAGDAVPRRGRGGRDFPAGAGRPLDPGLLAVPPTAETEEAGLRVSALLLPLVPRQIKFSRGNGRLVGGSAGEEIVGERGAAAARDGGARRPFSTPEFRRYAEFMSQKTTGVERGLRRSKLGSPRFYRGVHPGKEKPGPGFVNPRFKADDTNSASRSSDIEAMKTTTMHVTLQADDTNSASRSSDIEAMKTTTMHVTLQGSLTISRRRAAFVRMAETYN